ncbi:MAG TPA: hypothetical protein VE757_03265 [Gaiellaceae bacterium]|nr:hypothetical protein [Gaiellaceae bacterium]
MRRITSALAAACALVLVTAAGATDDGLWLFPASHGSGTIAAWRAQQGEADAQGGANQAILLEKDTTAPDTSAAAHVVGLEGLRVPLLGSFSYDYRAKDGVCSVTDPRWALFVTGRSGRQYVVNLGCKTSLTSSGAEAGWLRKTATSTLMRAEVLRKGGSDALNGQVSGVALVFDHAVGHAFVDHIRVQVKGPGNLWTYAGDNGGTDPPGGSPSFSADQSTMLAASLSADEQLSGDDLLASLTPEEWEPVNADPTG